MSAVARQTSAELATRLSGARTVRDAEAIIDRCLVAPTSRTAGHRHPALQGLPETIGIWRRAEDRVTYERDVSLDDENFWASTARIEAKTRRRIILLGESVARGAFIDPLFNPAMALGAYLDALCGPGEIEIVDLARNGLTESGLLQLAAESARLDPDVVLIFAGNNWTLRLSDLDCDDIAAKLEAGCSWRDLAGEFRAALEREVADTMSALARATRAWKVPVLFLVPTNNIRDLAWPAESRDPLLASEEQAAVDEHLAIAEQHMTTGEYDHAYASAARVVALDPVLSARALQICGICALARGDKAEAVQRFAEVEDSRGLLPLTGTLSCGPTLSAAIVQSAAHEGITTVDLRQLFLDANDGVPPGRELFLDQVHLTPAGMKLAMAAAAERLLPMLGRPAVPYRMILDVPVQVDAPAWQQGHFLAALIHSRPNQSELALYHARQAIRHDPDVAVLMRSMVRVLLSRTPEIYHRAYTEIVKASVRCPGLRLVLYGVSVAEARRPAYVELARALADAAETVLPGSAAECERLLRETMLHDDRPTCFRRHVIQWTDMSSRHFDRAYVRSFSARTHFRLRCGEPRDLALNITARRGPGRPGDATASLFVNGHLAHRWPLGSRWTSSTCALPASLFRAGVNEICIAWPDPGLTRADRAGAVAEMFRARPLDDVGFTSELYSVYGDVYVLEVDATAASSVS